MNRKLIAALVAGVCVTGNLVAEPAADRVVRKGEDRGVDVRSTLTSIDANQLDMFVTNEGNFAYDISNIRGKADGLYFPNTYPLSDKTVIYDAGMWLGGIRGSDTLVVVAEYSSEYTQGPLGGDAGAPENRVYKIYKDHLDKVANGYMVQTKNSGDPNGMELLSAEDYNNWPGPVGDDGTPWINEIGADQMTYAVYNDGDPALHTNDAGATDPIGMEVHQTTFAYNVSGPLGKVIFMQFEFIYNPGAVGLPEQNLEQAYVSLWADPDLGGAGDDYVGCVPEIGLGYCYNATNSDNAYGTAPPAVGFDFFQGPVNSYGIEWPPGSGETPATLPMTSFNKYINGTDPHSWLETYNYMRGLNADGTPLDNGTTFFHPGDPVSGSGDIDSDPADRRYMLSAGPFSMAPGDTNTVVAAVVAADGANRLSSITYLKFVDQLAQGVFDNNFQVKAAPEVPEIVSAVGLPRMVSISWDDNSVENPGDFDFQGYNVWQGQTASGPWERVATYDLIDDVETIWTTTFNAEDGNVYRQPTQFGLNTGLQFQVEITDDKFGWNGNTKLVNNHPYYFAVTAYNYSHDPADSLQNFVESPIGPEQVLILSPNAGPSGADWSTVSATVSHDAGSGTGPVQAEVINDWAITGNTYSLTFTDTTVSEWSPDDSAFVDVTRVNYYTLANSTTGDVLVPRGENLSGDLVYPYTEGMRVSVENHPEIVPAGFEWIPEDGSSARWLSGVDWGAAQFFGGLDFGMNFFGSTLTLEDMKTVEMRLTDDQNEWSTCAVYRRDLGYAFNGLGTFPGSLWDITVDPPRRLNVCMVEMDDPASDEFTADMMWNPNGAGTGGREYFFIMDSDYDEATGGGYDGATDGTVSDVLWAGWFLLRGSQTGDCATPESAAGGCFAQLLAERPGSLIFSASQPFTSNDSFTITTSPMTVRQTEASLNQVRAVPNPYYGRSSYELQADKKVLKFTNLPNNATIRIFNIAGDHVRTLQTSPASLNSDSNYEIDWNLKNDYDVYVASGVYVYHVEAPSYGESFGKVAVFLQEERLKDY